MHRRGVQCLPDIAGRSASSIQSAAASGSRSYSSFLPKHKPPRHLPDVRPAALESWPQRLAVAAVSKEGKKGWSHDKSYAGETHRLTAAVKTTQNTARLPSAEKSKFFSVPQDDAWDFNLQQLEVSGRLRIEPGTFVEVRRNGHCSHGVTLFDIPILGRWTVHTLLTSGEVWPHAEEDVMFAIPSFAEEDLVARCGRQPFVENEQHIAARVRILKRLRNFEMEFERQYNTIIPSIADTYYKQRATSANEWAQVSSSQIARSLGAKSKNTPIMTMFAVHKFLFSQPKYFVAEITNFLEKKSFRVRPWKHVQDLSTVDQMVLSKDHRLDAFVAKARTLITASRERSLATWKDIPSLRPDSHHSFTEDDMTIIRFFQASLRPTRSTQLDPYIVPLSQIMKKLEMYTGEVDDDMVHRFLMELGVLPPWEDLITRADSYEHLMASAAMVPTPARATSIARPPPDVIGNNDMYSRDIAESIRHDFGDMPVYVIDDFGAEELDDGISVESIPSEPGYTWLHVHIADPTAILPPTHAYSRQARRKLQSSYFIDRTIPMLPRVPIIANMSLDSGTSADDPQNVVTFSSKIDDQGNIVDYSVRAGLVRNVTLLRYADVDAALGLNEVSARYPFGVPADLSPVALTPISPAMMEDLQAAKRVARRLMDQRIRGGAFSYEIDSVKMELKTKPLPSTSPSSSRPFVFSGFPELVYKTSNFRDTECGSRGLVSECMKTANRIASCFFRDRGIPAIRRVVALPQSEMMDGYQQLLATRDEDGFVDIFHSLRLGLANPPAQYMLTPERHSTLGIPAGEGYARVTSPLRRFSDMVAHWQIKHALLHPDTPARMFSEEWLEAYAKDMVFREIQFRRAEIMQHEYWALRYLQRCIEERERTGRGYAVLDSLVGQISSHVVANIRKHHLQYSVIIPSLGLRATLKDDAGSQLGDQVDVKVDSIRLGLQPRLTVVRR